MFTFPPEKLKNALVQEGLLKAEQFDDALIEAQRMNQNVGDVIVAKGYITYEYLYNLFSSYFGVELAHLDERGVNPLIVTKIDEKFSRERGVVAFSQDADGTINVAMNDPSDLTTIEFLEKKLSAKIRTYLATAEDLSKGYVAYGSQMTADFKKIIEDSIKTSVQKKIGIGDKENEVEAAAQVPIVDIVNNLIAYAASLNTSDIHIEVLETNVLVRFRIDGILYEMIQIPKDVHPAILARIKLISALKIDEHQKPQDGRFRFKAGQTMLDARVSIIPTLYGEKIVMRLLLSSQRPLSLSELGMLDDMIKIVENNIKKTYGMVLVTGPTGSGKTTTLYSILNMLNRPEVNIVTVEDPIEYNIRFINQIQINPLAGITFASGLRSILRQDPNIILVGEIRDEETADIAVNAALTGHLLLSSLHTNDATTSIPRLIDMKIPSFLVAAVLDVVIAQRLVRKICFNCIESYTPTKQFFETLNDQVTSLGLPVSYIPKTLYRGKGCNVCNGSGYKGRMGIYEAFEVNDEIRKIVVDPNFALTDLINAAKKNGMITMFEDGLKKAALGMTSVEEVLRVIRE